MLLQWNLAWTGEMFKVLCVFSKILQLLPRIPLVVAQHSKPVIHVQRNPIGHFNFNLFDRTLQF